ncbi:MAG: aminodeoxychorismate synthase component I [Candidatus Omnitrophota bacterium]
MRKYFPEINPDPAIEEIKTARSPEEAFTPFAEMPGAALLSSSLRTDAGRYSFIGLEPFLSLKGKNEKLDLDLSGRKLPFKGNGFDCLQSVLASCKVRNRTSLPFIAGGIGYLSYDLKDILEHTSPKAKDDLGLSDICFVFYRTLIIYDNFLPGRAFISVLDFSSARHEKSSQLIKEIKKKLESSSSRTIPPKNRDPGRSKPVSNFSKNGYMRSVQKVIDYIRAGDIYQACLAQRFHTMWTGAPYDLYLRLNKINPAPFSAYLNFKDCKVISSSPELFLRMAHGAVETRPMKGTRPRGATRAKDRILKNQLIKSRKDDAELSMIVDLERNDIGKIAVPGSVEVAEHRRVETYPTVFQTISVVKGAIKKGAGPIDVIKAAFPGGSISGCPKIRAMEIIDELEPTKRGIYTGSIGYLSFHDTMDLNIAIRTMVMKQKDVYFHVGGGITAYSDPGSEHEETLDKARALLESVK